ncbi:hypothetical protein ACKKBG_A34440 [Auxenochlorella protothecoides x Auxenochlorella symbiontica]
MPQFTPGTAISDLELQLLELTVPYDEEVPEVSVRPEVVSFRQGQFAAAVASVLDLAPSEALATAESVPDWFAALGPALGSIGDDSVLVMGAAALCEFVRQNVTGPCPPGGSSCSPANSSAQTEIDVHEDRQKTENHPHGDRWAISQLSEDGEDVEGVVVGPQYLLLARYCLVGPPGSASPAAGRAHASWAWWAGRAALTQQRLLRGRSATLCVLCEELWSAAAAAAPAWPRALRVALALESAARHLAYSRVADARAGLDVADGLAGFGAELAGVLGTRTAHQTEAKAQLVVSVSRRGAWVRDRGAARVDDLLPPDVAAAGARPTQTPDGADDVLPGPRLVEGAGGRPPAAAAPRDLHSLEQALLLARAALLRKGSAGDAVRAGQLAAYAEAVVAQDLSQWVLATAARLQLARLELERPRTRIRGLASLEGVEEAGRAPGPPAAARLRCAFFGALPLRTPLRRELGEALVAAGAVASALPLFEGVELWDSVIVCYQLLGKRGAAEALVRRRLEVRPSDPRLWCALGDLSLDPGHYRRAWEASGGRSARAQRSLARLAAGAGRHAEAAGHWRAALALSPLHPEGWFSLGYACLKERDHAGARAAFTRAAQQQPDNGEAWNNLGAAHIALRAWRPAFAALTEALRHKRDSWQAWENYGAVAARAREWQAAAHALQEVLRLSDGARLDLEALEVLVRRLERGAEEEEEEGMEEGDGGRGGDEEDGDLLDPYDEEVDARLKKLDLAAARWLGEAGEAAERPTEARDAAAREEAAAVQAAADARGAATLQRAVHAVLRQAAACGAGGAELWGLFARYHEATSEDPSLALECRLKEVRALQGAAWQSDTTRFERFARASLALGAAHLRVAAAAAEGGGRRELSAARMYLRGVVRAAEPGFGDHALHAELRGALQDVQARLDAL